MFRRLIWVCPGAALFSRTRCGQDHAMADESTGNDGKQEKTCVGQNGRKHILDPIFGSIGVHRAPPSHAFTQKARPLLFAAKLDSPPTSFSAENAQLLSISRRKPEGLTVRKMRRNSPLLPYSRIFVPIRISRRHSGAGPSSPKYSVISAIRPPAIFKNDTTCTDTLSPSKIRPARIVTSPARSTRSSSPSHLPGYSQLARRYSSTLKRSLVQGQKMCAVG